MKRFWLLVPLVGVGFVAWKWFSLSPEPPPPVAVERPRRLAPRGVLYFTEYASLRTSQGVIGFEPGQEVRFVSATDRTLTVSDGQHQIEVQPRQLTNDLDIADLVRSRDEASQRQLAAFQAAELASYQHAQREFNRAHSARVDTFNRQQQETNAVGRENTLTKPAVATRSRAGAPSWHSPGFGGAYNYLQPSSGGTNSANGYNVNDWNR